MADVDPLPPLPVEEYNIVPFTTLNDEQLDAIVDRHRLSFDGPIVPMATNGVVHALWALGNRYVLRVPKRESMSLGDLRAEVVAIPIARAAGVRTPALVAFDDACDIVDVPYAIVDRVHGVDLTALALDDPRSADLYQQLGHQLAALHLSPLPNTHPWLRTPQAWASVATIDETVAAGMLDQASARWFHAILLELESAPGAVRFLHNDVKPDNLMVDVQGQLVLIDWGDAGVGDPAFDFATLPAAAIAETLVGYRSIIGQSAEPHLEQRIIHGAISRAVSGLRRSPLTGPSWYRPVAAGLADLLTFATDHPDTWHHWIGR